MYVYVCVCVYVCHPSSAQSDRTTLGPCFLLVANTSKHVSQYFKSACRLKEHLLLFVCVYNFVCGNWQNRKIINFCLFACWP